MMKAAKSVISFLLIVALVMGAFPVFAAAENSENCVNAPVDNYGVQASGGNNLGTLLAKDLEEQQDNKQICTSESYVMGVEVSGKKANVTLSVSQDCTVVVDLYSDYGNSLLASGRETVSAGTSCITVELASARRSAFPTYFGIEAYLLDEDGNRIAQSEYYTSLYTEDIQELLGASIYDYPEYSNDRIINLDERDDTNYGVLNENVIVISPKEGTNTVTSIDDQNGLYSFDNVDSQLTSLKPGDLVSYQYSDTGILLINVGQIYIEGDSVSIVSDEAEMSTFFDYMKIESEADIGDANITSDMLADGVTYTESEEASAKKSYNGSVKVEPSLSLNITRSFGSVKVELSGKFSVTCEFKYYLSLSKVEITNSFSTKLSASASVKGTLTLRDIPLTTVPLGFSPVAGLYIEFTPKVCVEVSAKVTFKAELSSKISFTATATAGSGFKFSKSNTTSSSKSFEFEGKVFVGIVIEPKIGLISTKILSLSAKLTAGPEFSVKIKRDIGDCVGSITSEHRIRLKLEVVISALEIFSAKATLYNTSWTFLPTKTETYNRHNFSAYGGRCCSKCGTEYSCPTDYSYGGKYAIGPNSTGYLYYYPYEYGSAVSSVRNCFVNISYEVVNSKGQRWLRTSSGYFILASKLTRDLSVVNPSLNVNVGSITYYQNQIPGDNMIVSSDTAINSISASLNGSSLGTTYPYACSVNLRNAGIMTNAKWGQLPMGSYTLTLTVNYSVGLTKTKSIPVTVLHVPVAAPSISSTDTYSGKTVTIRQNEPGGRLTYSYAGGTYSTSNTTVSFDITSSQSITAYSAAAADGYKSATTSQYYSVPKMAAPTITPDYISTGAMVSIASESKAVIYYSINGGSEQTYTGPFLMAYDGTVTARAEKLGCVPSNTGSGTVTLTPPSKPTVSRFQSEEKIAEGRSVSVSWAADKRADHYLARLYLDGTVVDEMIPAGSIAAFLLPEAGMYEITVQPINDFLGNGEESEDISFEAKAPSTVRFLDNDGSVLSEYKIPYADYLSTEKTPSHRGHYFSGWLPRNDYTTYPILEDADFTATYEKIEYDVSFYDVDGLKLGETQKVKYQESAEAPEYTQYIPVGYAFMGWTAIEASESDSICDYTSVDANLKFQAVVHWENDELPIHVETVSATADPVDGAPCYTVTVDLTNWPDATSDAYLCVALKNQDPETGVWKTVYAEKKSVKLLASQSSRETMQLFYSGIAGTAEVFMLSRKPDGTTSSAYSAVKSMDVTFTTLWTDWSEWSTTVPEDVEGRVIEEKTQYRYKDKKLTTSSNSSLSGWTQYDSSYTWSNWGAWSSWTTSWLGGNDYTQVEPRTAYHYYYYLCPNCGAHMYQYTTCFTWAGGCGYKYIPSSAYHGFYCENPYSNVYDFHGTGVYYTDNTEGNGRAFTYPYSSSQYYQAPVTQYRSRTRSQIWTYYFYQWPTEWNEWSDNAVSATSNRQVETRTVYRYKDEVHEYDTDVGQQDTGGTSYHFTGTLDTTDDLTGKLATVMVYKSKNMDPNQYQMQYVGQTTLLKNNTYDISFKTIDEPTEDSGNYVVCLGVQGTTGLVNVAVIEAPRAEYTVRYLNEDGSVITTQTVLEGDNAVVPEAPEIAGSQFVGWSDRGTNIYKNTDIYAKYVKEQCVVVFVDWVNQTIAFQNCHYGDTVTPVGDPEAEGYTFIGWDAVMEGNTTVTGNMVVTAVYEADTFTVRFLDVAGDTLTSQTVEYMGAAQLPDAPAVEDMIFLGWSNDANWWQVTGDVDVAPIYIYEQTAEIPQSNYGTEYTGEDIELELTSEDGATIYYTIDGSEPDENSEEYTGPIELTDESLTVRAVAAAPRKNVSPVLNFEYTAQSEFAFEDDGERVRIGSVDISAVDNQQITLAVTAEQLSALSSFRIAIDCDREVFVAECDDDGKYVITAGEALPEGELICEPTETGWSVFWNGETPVSGDGTLFIFTLKTALDFEAGTYPLTAYACKDYTLDENGLPAEGAAACLTFTDEIVACEEHSYAVLSDTATCFEGGTATYICYRCGTTYTATSEARGHDYVAQTTTATCIESGMTTYVCSLCGDEQTAEVVALGHDFTAGECTANCTEDGEQFYECSRCDATETEPAAATGHSYTLTASADTTCTENGYATYVCDNCGDTYTDEYEAEHLNVLQSMEDATCTEDGLMVYLCSRCGEVTEIVVPALGHLEEPRAAVEATCTEAGLTAGSFCLRCGEIIIAQEEIPAAHSFEETVTASTCSVPGEIVRTCSVCGITETEELPLAEHTPITAEAMAPTCTETGLTEGSVCSVCGTVLTEQQEVPVAGHSWEETGRQDPTCSEEGSAEYSCSVCGETRTETLPKAHHYVDGACEFCELPEELGGTVKYSYSGLSLDYTWRIESSSADDMTLYLGGTEYSSSSLGTISLCPWKKYASEITSVVFEEGMTKISAEFGSNHEFPNVISISLPDSLQEIGPYVFKGCSNLSSVSLPDSLQEIGSYAFSGCSNLLRMIVPANCTAIGSAAFVGIENMDIYVLNPDTEFASSAVGKNSGCVIHGFANSTASAFAESRELEFVEINLCEDFGHNFEMTDSREASCTQTGEAYFTCSVCGETKTETIEKVPHTPQTDEAVAPTCGQDGLTEGSHCAVCEEVLVAQQTILATGEHSYEQTQLVAPTCTEEGTTQSTCSVCGDTITETVLALGHTYDEGEITKYASCTETGKTVYICTVCGETKTEIIPMAEHMEGPLPEVLPTCTKTGLTGGSHCVFCGEILIEREVVPALGHTEEVLSAIAPTCTQKGLTEGSCCAVCGEILVPQEEISALGHTLKVEEGQDATCTEEGLTWGAYCTTCNKYIVKQKTIERLPHTETAAVVENNVPATCATAGSYDTVIYCAECEQELSRTTTTIAALGHDYVLTAAKAPTCTEDGATAGCVCTRCDSAPVPVVILPAVGHCDENGDNYCDICGVALAFDIHSAALKLNENINMVYTVDVPDDYTDPYMVFTYHGAEVTVTDYMVNDDGRYCFELADINPQCMGDIINATVYASCEGVEHTDTVAEYSVRDYCVNLLAKTDDVELTTLLSDILAYGAAAQTYTGYKTDVLVTDGLELTPSTFDAISGKNVSFTGEQDSHTYWTSASLVLSNDLAARFIFATDSTDGLTVEVSINGRTQTYTEFTDLGNGKYSVTFDGIMATEFDDTVTATFYRNGEQIGAAVNYSVNTYICSTQNCGNANLDALVKALYNYGASAKAYADTNK